MVIKEFIKLIKTQYQTIKSDIPSKIKNIGSAIFDVLISKKITNETIDRRNICNKCDNILNLEGALFCSICGCCIKLKTTVDAEKCPLNKW